MTRRMSPVATVFSFLGFLLLDSSAAGAASTLGLEDIFNDHMVLQRLLRSVYGAMR